MNRDPEDFESLRRLLAWKRHEQPPPGYFNDFSRRVMARIEAGEQGADPAGIRTWLQRLWAALETRPVFAGAFGAAVCAFLVVGMLNSETAPVVTIHPETMPTQNALAPASQPDSEVAVTRAALLSTNSSDWLSALFSQNRVSVDLANTPHDLLGDH